MNGLDDSQSTTEPRADHAVVGDDHRERETPSTSVIATIQELWRQRQAWHRAEKSLTLQAGAICRRYVGGDKEAAQALLILIEQGKGDDHAAVACAPLLQAREHLAAQRASLEKTIVSYVKQLALTEWACSVSGVGPMLFASLVGECGDIGAYKSVSAVWKRMGLAVIDGERQRRVAGVEALKHGYAPYRRAVAWNVGACLIRSQRTGDPYRDFYDREKEKQLAKGLPKGHAHNRACRHMTKRFLADLYGAAQKDPR